MFKKRAQGLSINVIIIAIIALIVIVVIISILNSRLGLFSAGLESIGDPTKKCQGSAGNGGILRDTCRSFEKSIVSSDAIAEGKKCCKGASSTTTTKACAKVNEDCSNPNDCCSGFCDGDGACS